MSPERHELARRELAQLNTFAAVAHDACAAIECGDPSKRARVLEVLGWIALAQSRAAAAAELLAEGM